MNQACSDYFGSNGPSGSRRLFKVREKIGDLIPVAVAKGGGEH